MVKCRVVTFSVDFKSRSATCSYLSESTNIAKTASGISKISTLGFVWISLQCLFQCYQTLSPLQLQVRQYFTTLFRHWFNTDILSNFLVYIFMQVLFFSHGIFCRILPCKWQQVTNKMMKHITLRKNKVPFEDTWLCLVQAVLVQKRLQTSELTSYRPRYSTFKTIITNFIWIG